MARLRERIETVMSSEDYSEEERGPLVRLMLLFAELPAPPDPDGDFPKYREYKERFLTCAAGEDAEALEEAFLNLYAHLHMNEAKYREEERRLMDEAGGYWAHAGGLSPILKAGSWIRPDTVSTDLGAGNGLQGLLFQYLYPHEKTVLIEISSRMVEIGKRLQAWLGIPNERVEWVTGDVCDQSLDGVDFIYLYRPVRPSTDRGRAFYEDLAALLDRSQGEVVIFSIADCLKEFLSPRFDVFYDDGHLTCFRSLR
jgi:methylase of polypeptide subunit release factors